MKQTYNFSNEEIEQIIKDYVENFLSYKDLMKKYNIKSSVRIRKILEGYIRSTSEALKAAHIKYPEAFKPSNETKAKIRAARLKFMAEHPEQTAWRKTNKSYPEEQFEKFLIEYGYANKYLIEREFSIFPYFIDFAFVDLKIAIEIDGSQHLEESRKQKDLEKDKLLQESGWRIIRFAENVVKSDWGLVKKTLDTFINSEEKTSFEQVGIIKAPKRSEYIKKERNEIGLTDRQMKYYKDRNQKTDLDLPNKDLLLKQITENSFEAVGRMYNVTGNAIKKWCKRLNIPSTKYELGQREKERIPDVICIQCGKMYHPDRRNSKFCSRECQIQHQFEHSKIGNISKETVLRYINNKTPITKACAELDICRASMHRLCKHHGIEYKTS